ncbi:MAG TPA: NADH-quinone oxidoreductase subunit J [Actinomycetes bacterium]|jgi:NADH-quinone oxidoreductase subunit J|nr:NADH-quinone oxidoreductase subunit J [Actinomycetes bacterium]
MSLLQATAVLAATTPAQRAELVTFLVLAPVSVLTALGMVLNRHAVYSALMLVVNFFCLAAFYVLLQAQFLAAVQVIVYAGAIMVLFLFVLMLLGVSSEDVLSETIKGQRPAAAVLVALLLAGVVWALFARPFSGSGVDLTRVAGGDNVRAIGQLLFTRYLFAFEATGLLLVVAAVGALVLAKRRRP